jgi:hypothetical protein
MSLPQRVQTELDTPFISEISDCWKSVNSLEQPKAHILRERRSAPSAHSSFNKSWCDTRSELDNVTFAHGRNTAVFNINRLVYDAIEAIGSELGQLPNYFDIALQPIDELASLWALRVKCPNVYRAAGSRSKQLANTSRYSREALIGRDASQATESLPLITGPEADELGYVANVCQMVEDRILEVSVHLRRSSLRLESSTISLRT